MTPLTEDQMSRMVSSLEEFGPGVFSLFFAFSTEVDGQQYWFRVEVRREQRRRELES